MIQLRILSGQTAGNVHVVRRFPFCIGRAQKNDLVLDEPGVWESHLTLDFQRSEGFMLHTAAGAFAAVNAEQQPASTRLRNGDIISFGAAKIQFWLDAPRQRGLRFRELFVWLLLAGVTAFQIVLIYQLLK